MASPTIECPGDRLERPDSCLSLCLIRRRPRPFACVRAVRIAAVHELWRTLVNAGQHCWKACWVQPLASSNPPSSATLTRHDAWSRPLIPGLSRRPLVSVAVSVCLSCVPDSGRETAWRTRQAGCIAAGTLTATQPDQALPSRYGAGSPEGASVGRQSARRRSVRRCVRADAHQFASVRPLRPEASSAGDDLARPDGPASQPDDGCDHGVRHNARRLMHRFGGRPPAEAEAAWRARSRRVTTLGGL
jgi:hypothetical protein